MSACVHILKFEKSGKYYVGSTTDIKRRLNQHKIGHTASTKRLSEILNWSSLKILRP